MGSSGEVIVLCGRVGRWYCDLSGYATHFKFELHLMGIRCTQYDGRPIEHKGE